MISGLIRIIGPSPISITTMRFRIPTCGAARPTPIASYIVSSISLISTFVRIVIFVTSLHSLFRTSSPNSLIFLSAISFVSPLSLLLIYFLIHKILLKNIHRIKIKLYSHVRKSSVDLYITFHMIFDPHKFLIFSAFQI